LKKEYEEKAKKEGKNRREPGKGRKRPEHLGSKLLALHHSVRTHPPLKSEGGRGEKVKKEGGKM